jgi:gamma-D-glutamyl-L-lysine dipeptidyl-peptidase
MRNNARCDAAPWPAWPVIISGLYIAAVVPATNTDRRAGGAPEERQDMLADLHAIINSVGQAFAADPRTSVFEVRARQEADAVVLSGMTTEPAAVEALIARVTEDRRDARVVDEIVYLPDVRQEHTSALVRSAVAPLHADARVASTQISQALMGQRLVVLNTAGKWCRVRGEDGYIGWIHCGYLVFGDLDWAMMWERGTAGEPVVSLGGELVDDEERLLVRLPWGARLIGDTPSRYALPDGRRGTLAAGEVVAADRLFDRFPLRRDSVARTARRWLGSPYLWGGVTPWGVDCSGLVQAVFWAHGVGMPRDSDQQVSVGVAVDAGGDEPAAAGDILFFADTGDRISHVAIALGGSQFIHSALDNGGVQVNQLAGTTELERRLREQLVTVRRVLPD